MKQEIKTFHQILREKMDEYVHFVYSVTKHFPKVEMYGVVSQIRRASLSVALNYIEGYARDSVKIHRNFLGISYGSLQESKYLLDFSFDEEYLIESDYKKLVALSDEIGKMLWGILRNMKRES